MAKVLTDSYEGNTPAIIVIKDSGYKQLVNTLSRRLALDGCEVKTTNSLDYNLQNILYVIFIGAPNQQDLIILNSFTHKLIVIARASELSNLNKT